MLNGSINYTDLKLMKRCKQKCDAKKYRSAIHFSFLPLKSLTVAAEIPPLTVHCPGDEIHFVLCIQKELSISTFLLFCRRSRRCIKQQCR